MWEVLWSGGDGGRPPGLREAGPIVRERIDDVAVSFDGRRGMNGTRPARAGLAGLALLASVGLTALPGAEVGAQPGTPAA